MASMDEIQRMRAASGAVSSRDRTVAFLYLLARDSHPLGPLEDALDSVADVDAPTTHVFTNGWLAAWAQDAATRLRGPMFDELEKEYALLADFIDLGNVDTKAVYDRLGDLIATIRTG